VTARGTSKRTVFRLKWSVVRVLYTGSEHHGGGANLTDDTRIGIRSSYAVGWLRQEENQYLSVPLDIARNLPVDLLRLMGYEIVDVDTAFVALGRAFGGDAETTAGEDEA